MLHLNNILYIRMEIANLVFLFSYIYILFKPKKGVTCVTKSCNTVGKSVCSVTRKGEQKRAKCNRNFRGYKKI